MKNVKLIALLLALSFNYVQAQDSASHSDQSRTVEINNNNGELSITFINGEITEFIVNDESVTSDRYGDYQSIIDDFAKEEIAPPSPPSPPTPSSKSGNESEELRTTLSEYLMNEGYINSFTKYKVDLRRKQLKVNGKKMPEQIHLECLNIFEEIYGHSLNNKSKVKFKKTRGSSSSSINIID